MSLVAAGQVGVAFFGGRILLEKNEDGDVIDANPPIESDFGVAG